MPDHALNADNWRCVADDLAKEEKVGVIFVDDAHLHIHELNELIATLASHKIASLKVLIASSRNNWEPRVKSPYLFKAGSLFLLSRLDQDEIDRLLSLVNGNSHVGRLVEASFAGFSTQEKRRRLVERCESEMFVCMRNIFASESFDDIILREYADLSETLREVYRLVAALEDIGVRIHRQLVIRVCAIEAAAVSGILDGLADIVTEYTIDRKEHIFGWKGRHPVISSIVTRYKFTDVSEIVNLFDLVIDNIFPTYDIEIRSIRELCNISSGISRISDLDIQNRLLRKLISLAPGERVPRHRLIRNLIRSGNFDQAQTEIRIFENDFGSDGPVARYNVQLLTARATRTPGILNEDRIVILERARQLAVAAVERFQYAPPVFGAYCEVGLAIYELGGRPGVFEDAMAQMREAEDRLGDPAISRQIREYDLRFERLLKEELA